MTAPQFTTTPLAISCERRTDDSFRSIVEHSTDLVARLDRDGRHLYVNPAMMQLLGGSVADVIGRSCREIPGMEALADILEPPLAGVFADGHEAEVEVAAPLKEGGARWYHTRLIPEWDTRGNVETVLMDARDITKRKNTERLLGESEERFRFLVEESRQVFFYVHARDHRFEYISPSVETVLGYTAAELVGQPYDVLLVKEAAEKVHRETEESFGRTGDKTPSLYLARVRRRDGMEIILELVERGVCHAGQPSVMQGFARDVTERERAADMETFLVRASRILSSTLDYGRTLKAVARLAVPTMADWCVVDVVEENGTVVRLAARHADKEMQPVVGALLDYPPDMTLEEGIPRVLRTGETIRKHHVDMTRLTKAVQDEEHRRILEHLGITSGMIVPLCRRGRTFGALSFVTSHSGRHYTDADQKTAERLGVLAAVAIENARLHRDALEASWARQELLSFVSHDLKNPLNVVVNASSLLEERAADPSAVRKYCPLIRRAVEQMNLLIADLLTASRMEAGRFWVEPEPADPGRLMTEAVEMTVPIAETRDVTLRWHDPGNLPAVQADARRVLQVLQNLVGNALDLTPDGGEVRLAVEVLHTHVRFTVSDDGPGIAEADRARVFEQFYQAGEKKKVGWGLGLAITRGIVQAHGGEIVVDSTEGSGATFAFTLPLA
jgi:PAS domain S-box-containing protein